MNEAATGTIRFNEKDKLMNRYRIAIIGIVLAMANSQAQAEIVTIDVTVKSIDAKERSITVTKSTKSKSKDIELEVGKKAKIRVDGKDAVLDAVKAGQKASVSYETELEVVTTIEVTGNGVALASQSTKSEPATFKKNGCRVVWTISETGDAILTISRPLEKREAAKDSLIRHDDGTVEFQHDLNTPESTDKSMMGAGENVEFDKIRKALVFKPNTIKGYEFKTAHFTYAKIVQLPMTIEYEFDLEEPSGGFPFGLNIRNRRTNTEFPFLNIRSKDDFKTIALIECSFHANRDANGKAEFKSLLKDESVVLKDLKEFRFRIPLNVNDHFLPEFGKVGASPAVLRYVSIRGRLKPTLGIRFAEKSGGVFAEKVLPKGLGETVGIKPGDVLVSINGNTPKTLEEAMGVLGKIQLGDESEIVVKRGGKTVKIGFTAE